MLALSMSARLPAVDVNRIVLGRQLALAAVLIAAAVTSKRRRRR